MTLDHAAVSSAIRFTKSAGVPPTASIPIPASCSRILGLLAATLNAAFSFSTIGAGNPAGPSTPNQVKDTNPGSCSEIAGNSGTSGERSAEETPKARTLPSRTCGYPAEKLSKSHLDAPQSNQHCQCCTFIWDVSHLRARQSLKALAGQMRNPANTRRTEIQFARIGFSHRNKLRHRLGR